MIELGTIRVLLDYSDWSNRRLLECAAPVSDALLDTDLQIGPGTLRKILLHTLTGETVWLLRWKQTPEVPWPSEAEKVSVEEMGERFQKVWTARDEFIDSIEDPARLNQVQVYRDSRGNRFQAALGHMLMQGCMHSKHHQAQACNALKRLGASWPELDYMMRVRMPVQE